VRIARLAGEDDKWFWGVLNGDAQTVRRLVGPMGSWSAWAATDDYRRLPLSGSEEPVSRFRLLAPLDPAARVFGVGGNYRAHLERAGISVPPAHPVAFMKPNSAIIAPLDEIRYPPTTEELDYEVELVVVMSGSPAAPVLGFTIGNDVSARDATGLGGLDLFSMKCLDGTTPLGPWIVTPAELGAAVQPHVDITLLVNGELRQQDNTAMMLWPVPELLNYINDRVVLRCGDAVFTGTTAGVGFEDGRFLQPGDLIEAAIEGIGVLRNTVGLRQVIKPDVKRP